MTQSCASCNLEARSAQAECRGVPDSSHHAAAAWLRNTCISDGTRLAVVLTRLPCATHCYHTAAVVGLTNILCPPHHVVVGRRRTERGAAQLADVRTRLPCAGHSSHTAADAGLTNISGGNAVPPSWPMLRGIMSATGKTVFTQKLTPPGGRIFFLKPR